ncbi:NAD(P)H-binding protein [Streptomyces sp. CBMA152]|uniref:NAD(P)H-binding protein n=1 Tax=Streptomyces sp. CBMA152 TaxID=1896312 RepID=UPI00166091FC|nr:NAD(P)H-binding protein [Streptomyces sp. CBMA152]MBD0740972.1 NmrA family transcriptional regulator [Streptomyces sp. CBMA152]
MIVVTGATGNVGRHLVHTLAAAGERVTALSRRVPTGNVPSNVEFQQADPARTESLKRVLDGADALYLLVPGDGEGFDPYAILDTVRAAGVRRVVLQSSQATATRPHSPAHARLRAFEDAVRESGLGWTVLRPSGFASNAYMWAASVHSERTVAAPFGEVGLPVIDPADIAAVATVALRDGSHAGRTYELTGPAPVSPREQARAIGDALGVPVRFVEQSRAEAREVMLRFMPEPAVEGTLGILGEPTAEERRVSPAVERILGRAPRTFAAWAADNVVAFR